MAVSLTINAVNQITKGTVLYQAQDPAASICMVLKGRIQVSAKGLCCLLGPGSFLGIPDAYSGTYFLNYEAVEEASVYAFAASDAASVKNIIKTSKDYRGIMTASLSRQASLFASAQKQLLESAEGLCRLLEDALLTYKKEGAGQNIPLSLPLLPSMAGYLPADAADPDRLAYYTECSAVPPEVQKAYFSSIPGVAACHMEEMAGLLALLAAQCQGAASYILDAAGLLCGGQKEGFFKGMLQFLTGLKRRGLCLRPLERFPEQILLQLNLIQKSMAADTWKAAAQSLDDMEQLYADFQQDAAGSRTEEPFSEDVQKEAASLTNSMEQILRFAEFEEEPAKKLKLAVQYFKLSNNRLSVEDTMRLVKKEISNLYYKLYSAVFLKTRDVSEIPKSVRLFLDYGFLDEGLLEEEQLLELCSIQPEQNQGPCQVYTMYEWLQKIYRGEKDTSKNEFDENYASLVRNDRKKNLISEAEEAALYQDGRKCADFEIHNMLKINTKITNAQLSTFVPILYRETFLTSITKSRLTKQAVNDMVQKLAAADYAVFHHTVLYVRPELKIKKEYVVQTIYPDIILTPIAGQQGSMWQETSNKRKDTPARFIFPAFMQGSLEDQMLKVFARYRWEICRSVQGISWNNIQEKSLTSEYCDYIQFYRKNGELTEERKEKLKLQLQKARNNNREVFVLDYETWMKHESAGAVRLNKVAREILAVYCPFHQEIRARLAAQPIFAEAMARYNREKAKKVKEIELRYHALQKEGAEITQELAQTLDIYKNM